MTKPIYGWLARRRFGAAEALDAMTNARRRAATSPAPAAPKPNTPSRWIRALTATVAALVLAGAATIALVVVGTQVGFYRQAMRTQTVDFSPLPLPTLDLPVFTPLATEGVVWLCTLMAVVLVILNRRAGLWIRSMWLFAAIAAFVNTFHAVENNHDLLGGVVTGGLSIAGPFVVHLFVLWVRHVRTGQTLAEARVDTAIRWGAIGRHIRAFAEHVLDHVVHPKTALLTIWVWRAFRGMSYDNAWTVASERLRKSVLAQCRKPPGKPRAATPDKPVDTTVPEPVDPPVEDRAHGAVLAPERDDDALDESAFHTQLGNTSQVDAILRDWTDKVRAQGATSGDTGAQAAASHPTSQGRSTAPKAVRTPTKKRGRTPRNRRAAQSDNAVEAQTDRGRITAEYWRRIHANEPVTGDGVNLSELARRLGIHRTTASKTWKECANGARPDPDPHRK
jgi:hypothetical protein